MIRAVATKANGTKVLLLGVDEDNVQRLKDGRPIHVNAEAYGLPCDVIIVYGKTMQHVIDELKAAGFEVPIDRAPVVTPDRPVIFRPAAGKKRRGAQSE